MVEYGAENDAWPMLYERVEAADILVIGTPIWRARSRPCAPA